MLTLKVSKKNIAKVFADYCKVLQVFATIFIVAFTLFYSTCAHCFYHKFTTHECHLI